MKQNTILNLYDNTIDLDTIIDDKKTLYQIKYLKDNIINLHNEFFDTYKDQLLEVAKLNGKSLKKSYKETFGVVDDFYNQKHIEEIFKITNNFKNIIYLEGAYDPINNEGHIRYTADASSQEEYALVLPNDSLNILLIFFEKKFKESNIDIIKDIDINDEVLQICIRF